MKISLTFVISLLLFFCISNIALTQNAKVDSLKLELKNNPQKDTTRVHLLNALSYGYTKIDIDSADKMAQEAYDLSKQIGYIKGEAKSLLRLSYNQLKKANLGEAENLALKALKLCENIYDQDCKISCYKILGEIAYYDNDIEKSKNYYKKVLDDNIEKGNLLEQADMLNNLGILSYRKGDFDEALRFFKEAYGIRAELGKEKLSLGTLNNIGAICLNQGRYREALEYFNKCLTIHRKDQNKRGIVQASYNISAVHYELKQYDKTLNYLEEALPLCRELKDKRQIASGLIKIGTVYADLKEFPKALDYMTESLRISNEIEDKSELSAGHFQLGDLYLLMNQPEKALKHYYTCLDLSKTIESSIYICHASIGLARSYVALNDYSKALIYTKKGKEIAEDLELLVQQKMVSDLLATIYSKTGNYKKAFESHKKFKTLNDSIFNKENIEKITQLEYDYKYKQALDSANIRELKLTKTVLTTTQDLEKSQRNYLWAIIAVLLLSILLGAFVFYQKLKNAKSKTQNVIMEQKLLRSQMTPHFIFNSLSVLQGMILNKEQRKSVNYLSKFSKLLRITLENSRDKTVSLSQELKAIQNYLTLQNLENDAYQSTLLVEDSIDVPKFEVPPMLIQPFVENAIEHAFKDKPKDRRIDIRLKYSEKKLICTIADNGIGYTAQKTTTNGHKKSLSTAITSERLKILSKDFKMEGSVSIVDRKAHNEQGTLVTLVIPHKIILV
ncbi:tetratricopeptide repeat protein [Hyunsoonleella flava]|uniref:Tetratricopeptide repeat protein n=1 Tax=Hyunsoonleella flava TaxID=2527939 RepID=A0A4Q9FIB3_9FLAO|nr:tetratricopeptide repeat protein [Hyunsoonleella flava]TBN06722.1 tetratricopeptide repeat protein [Hyunsoonleella flava]